MENDFYYGDGLETVLGLLGGSKKRRFISEIGNAHMHKREIWNNLVKFLEKEFTLCENLTAYEKAEQCLNINAWNKGATRRGVNQTFYKHSTNVASVHDKMECYICGKDDHAISISPNGFKSVQYFSCKKFVEKSPHDRLKLLDDKNLCRQCLNPGVTRGHTQRKCYDWYTCKDLSHLKCDLGYHVLVCDKHKNNNNNLKVLESY